MKDFDWTSFTRKIAINAPIEVLYDAWTKPDEIERWFLSRATFYDASKSQVSDTENVSTNSTYEWSWYLYDVVEKGSISKANGIDEFEFSFAGDCVVNIKLKQENDAVVVVLKQSNIPTDDNSKKKYKIGL